MNKKSITIVVIGVVLLATLAYVLGCNANNEPKSETPKVSVQEQEKPPTTQKFEGGSDSATEPFHLNKGSVRIEIAYAGTTQITASLIDKDGKSVVFMISDGLGSYNGSTVEHIDASGDYSLVVKADGPWTITIKQ